MKEATDRRRGAPTASFENSERRFSARHQDATRWPKGTYAGEFHRGSPLMDRGREEAPDWTCKPG